MKPVEREPARKELPLKLFFGQWTPIADNIKQIKQFRDRQVQLLDHYQRVGERLEIEDQDKPGFPYWLIVLRAGQSSVQASIQWCDESVATLEGLAKKEPETYPKSNQTKRGR